MTTEELIKKWVEAAGFMADSFSASEKSGNIRVASRRAGNYSLILDFIADLTELKESQERDQGPG